MGALLLLDTTPVHQVTVLGDDTVPIAARTPLLTDFWTGEISSEET